MRQRVKQSTPRWLALVALGAVALGSYAIAPAVGGPGNLTTKKAKRLFYTKKKTHARFYTKNQSNFRYFTREVASARFVPRQSGEHAVTLDPYDWAPGAGNPVRMPGEGFVSFQDNGPNTGVVLHDGSLPHAFAGKGLRLSAIEVCFEPVNATVDRLQVRRSGPVGGGDPIPTQVTFIDQNLNDSSDQCRKVSSPPAVVGGAAVIDLELTVDFSGAGELRIGRTTAFFVP
jgi:hypothetical protein